MFWVLGVVSVLVSVLTTTLCRQGGHSFVAAQQPLLPTLEPSAHVAAEAPAAKTSTLTNAVSLPTKAIRGPFAASGGGEGGAPSRQGEALSGRQAIALCPVVNSLWSHAPMATGRRPSHTQRLTSDLWERTAPELAELCRV